MTKRMLIDATHAEETRVVVLDGNRLEDFDVETSTKRQLKGNIYLAKVVRVEPSLQAAFVEYGGNRHGFLAFSEIHPDYYQIPVADRQRLIEMQAEEARREEEEAELELALGQGTDVQQANSFASERPELQPADQPIADDVAQGAEDDARGAGDWARPSVPLLIAPDTVAAPVEGLTPDWASDMNGASDRHIENGDVESEAVTPAEPWATPESPPLLLAEETVHGEQVEFQPEAVEQDDEEDADSYDANDDNAAEPPPETMGGDQDNGDDQRERRLTSRFMRNYKIQEVIRRRQILLVQVVKEERGTKGAALTTYLSLAGRFGVLMPNSPRGGGHLAQDHLGHRSPSAEGGHGGTRHSAWHGPDRAHRGCQPAEARDQARLRIPAAAVGRHPRAHAEIGGAGADLRGSQPDQAGDPRRLLARHR